MPDDAALARRDPNLPDDDGGIDPRLAAALVAALVDYPSFDTACAACGQTSKAVRSMLQRGVQVGAPAGLREFAKRAARADAENARMHQEIGQKLLADGNSAAARIVFQTIEARWPTAEQDRIMAILTSGKQSANLQARLERPGPALTGLIARMLRSPNAEWRAILEGAGLVRAMAEPVPDEPESSEPGEVEPAEEPGADAG